MGAVADVGTYLTAQGLVGGLTGWDLIRRRIMDTPVKDTVVVLMEDGGPPPEYKPVGGDAEDAFGIGDAALKDVGVHVLVRAQEWDSDASLAKAQAIFDALHGRRGITLGSTMYLRIAAMTPEPIFTGYDEQGRPRHTIAFRLLSGV